jgi:hypothetical protein
MTKCILLETVSENGTGRVIQNISACNRWDHITDQLFILFFLFGTTTTTTHIIQDRSERIKLATISMKKSNICKVKCNECNVVLQNNTRILKNHMNSWHTKSEDKELLCKKCNFLCTTRHELKRHFETVHPSMYRYQCELCPAKKKIAAHLLTHIEATHLNLIKWKCGLCDYASSNGSNFPRHMKAMHQRNKDLSTVELIENVNMVDKYVVLHPSKASSVNNDVIHSCINAEKELPTANLFTRRELQVDQFEREEIGSNEWSNKAISTDLLRCNECEFSSGEENDLKTHIQYVHQKTGEKNSKDEFVNVTESNGNDKNCQNVNKKEDNEVLIQCEESDLNNFSLTAHLDTKDDSVTEERKNENIINNIPVELLNNAATGAVQSEENETNMKQNVKVKCNHCDMIVGSHSIKTHIRRLHTKGDGNIFRCKTCGFVRETRHELKMHHETVRHRQPTLYTHQCQLCPAKFKYPTFLRRHLESAVHFNMRRWRCNFCDHSANIRSNLTSHMKKIHTGKNLPIKLVKNEKKKENVLFTDANEPIETRLLKDGISANER